MERVSIVPSSDHRGVPMTSSMSSDAFLKLRDGEIVWQQSIARADALAMFEDEWRSAKPSTDARAQSTVRPRRHLGGGAVKKEDYPESRMKLAAASRGPAWIDELVESQPYLLTTMEAATVLRVSTRHVYRLIAAERLERIRPTESGSSPLLIPRSSIEAYLRRLAER
jgi:excisionase family DNA binding protein